MYESGWLIVNKHGHHQYTNKLIKWHIPWNCMRSIFSVQVSWLLVSNFSLFRLAFSFRRECLNIARKRLPNTKYTIIVCLGRVIPSVIQRKHFRTPFYLLSVINLERLFQISRESTVTNARTCNRWILLPVTQVSGLSCYVRSCNNNVLP